MIGVQWNNAKWTNLESFWRTETKIDKIKFVGRLYPEWKKKHNQSSAAYHSFAVFQRVKKICFFKMFRRNKIPGGKKWRNLSVRKKSFTITRKECAIDPYLLLFGSEKTWNLTGDSITNGSTRWNLSESHSYWNWNRGELFPFKKLISRSEFAESVQGSRMLNNTSRCREGRVAFLRGNCKVQSTFVLIIYFEASAFCIGIDLDNYFHLFRFAIGLSNT